MKARIPLLLASLLAIVGLLIAFWPDETSSASPSRDTTDTPIKKPVTPLAPAEKTDHIPVKTPPKEMPTLRASHRDDPSSTAALIDIISRHPEETKRLVEENQWIKRREIVEREQSFRDIAARILDGEKVDQIEVPLFDGETVTFVIDHNITSLGSRTSGVFHGNIKDEPDAFAVLSFYKDSDSGLISMPRRQLAVQYEGWGDRRVIVKDYNESEQARALPCQHCRIDGSSTNHNSHPTSPPQQ